MLDNAIFSSGIHALKNKQDSMTVGCIEKLLLGAQLADMFFQKFLILLIRIILISA